MTRLASGLALACFGFLGSLVPAWADSAPPLGPSVGGPVQAARLPRASGALPLSVRFRLRSGFDLAVERLERVPECQGLFAALGVDGVGVLGAASFEMPAGPQQGALCLRAVAFASPGSGQIVICPVQVQAMSRREVAAVLLHEALHLAGLAEWPYERDAVTSEELTRRVKARCAL